MLDAHVSLFKNMSNPFPQVESNKILDTARGLEQILTLKQFTDFTHDAQVLFNFT